MKEIKFLLVLILVSTMTFFINSCTKNESLHEIESNTKSIHEKTNVNLQSRDARQENSKERFTILGRKRNNPYTVANMTLAFNALYGTNQSSLPKTHNYVKFAPTITEHLAYIEEWETETQIAVFDFPLEYEIITAGEKYIDPNILDSIYTYQYASIPIGVELPNVPYQLLEELFIPPINSYVAETAFYLVGEEYEGRTTKHPEWSDPPEDDDCNPNCDNYPCCLLGWFDCGGFECGDPVLPCMPGDPDWPECLDIYPPIDPPVNPPADPEYCYCTEYENGEEVFGYVVELGQGEKCSDYEDSWPGSEVICETYTPPPPTTQVTNQCGCTVPVNKKHPSGCVMVQNDSGSFIPVQIASIKVKDTWFTSDITYTNDNGCWEVNESYSGNVWMWVRFKNPNVKVRSTHYWSGTIVVRDYVGKFTTPPYNNILVEYSNVASPTQANNRMYWACAHTLNTVNEYRNRAAMDGIPLPRTGLNYHVHNGGGASSAPMLQNNIFNSWITFLTFFMPVYNLSLPLLPDITNQYTDVETARRFNGVANHELGHASHYSLVGEGFWFGYRNHIINNFISDGDMYGTFGDFALLGSDPEKVAISEALGNYMGHIYGATDDGGNGNEWANDNFIPQGLMFDLTDDDTPFTDWVTDPNDGTIRGIDNITGFTRTMIWNALDSDIDEVRKFRDRLRVMHLSDTPNNVTDYNTFVDIYDVFEN